MFRSSFYIRYGLALSLVAVAFVTRLLLTPLLDHTLAFFFFLPAALLAALFGRIGPGILTLAGGLIIGDFFFLPPILRFGPYAPAELTVLVIYLITGLIGVWIIEQFHRTRNYAQELEQRVAERTASLRNSLSSLEGVLYHVAHDLRAPLRAMHSFTRLLLEQYEDRLDSTGADYARRISAASLKMDALVHDLLDYGKLSCQPIVLRSVDVSTLLERVVSELQMEITSCAAEIQVDPPLPPVSGDVQVLGQVLNNLIGNALKFVAPETTPRIHIWAHRNHQSVQLHIRDNGIGIPPQHQQRIFGVFERLHSAQSYSGTGMGLAIVHKGMERLDGRVTVESNLGQGTHFCLELKPAPPKL